MTKAAEITKALLRYQNKVKLAFFPRYFKTGKGEYAEGDEFLGVTVPNIKLVAKNYQTLSFPELKEVLASPKHEVRLLGAHVLVAQFARARTRAEQTAVYRFYLQNLTGINHWDIVDASTHKLIGVYVLSLTAAERDAVLVPLAEHCNVWRRRVALVAMYRLIKERELVYVSKFLTRFVADDHQLIHKGLGWMLRELGKYAPERLSRFLHKYHRRLAAVTICYATEKMARSERALYYKRKSKSG